MPSFKIAGKSKEDLALVVQLSGLLSADEANQLTRTELVKILERENRKAEASDSPGERVSVETVEITATDSPRGKREARIKKALSVETPIQPAEEPVAEPAHATFVEPIAALQSAASEKPTRQRPVRVKKTASPAIVAVETVAEAAAVIPPEAKSESIEISVADVVAEAENSATPPKLKRSGKSKAKKTDDHQSPAQLTLEPVNPAAPENNSAAGVEQPDVMATETTLPSPEISAEVAGAPDEKVKARSRVKKKSASTEESNQPVVSQSAEVVPVPVEVQPTVKSRARRKAAEPAPAESSPENQAETAPVKEEPALIAEVAVETSAAPETVSQPANAEASPVIETATHVGRGGRRGRKPQAAIETPAVPTAIQTTAIPAVPETPAVPAEAESPAASLPVAPEEPASADMQAADMPQSGEPGAEPSPEATEAASDLDDTKGNADIHRVPPHHTLLPARPGVRRTRVIGNPAETAGDGQMGYARPQPAADKPLGHAPARQPVTGRRPVGATERPIHQTYSTPVALENTPLNDYGMSGAEQTALESDAGQTATVVPISTSADMDGTKIQRPFVETGEVQAGVLEIMPDGYGFLRKENYLQGNKDIYVPPQYIRRFGLRPGDYVTGPVKLQRETDRYQALLYIKDVNGMPPEKMLRRPHFDRLTPIYPDERYVLETVRNELSTRIIDLVAPIGKGQRGMIVSPPKAGKTILLQKIANAISTNNPDVKLIVLLIDERPEEVTDMQRSIKGEVVYSTFDKTPENHTKVTELVLERAMRLVELKQDVVILLDSMTRLARAYNLTINPTGRTLSGGLDPGALYGPKRFFGAARNIENGGSLTIIATSLIETGSRMDEVIFEEFKGTGNMEVYLDRKMSEKRIFPAIDINKSGTRREELLMTSKELDAVWTIRKAFSQLENTAVTEAIINLLLKTKNNEHFIASVNVSFNDKNVFEAMRGVRPQDAAQNQNQSGGRSSGTGYGGGYNNSGYNSNYRRQQQTNDDD